MKGIGSFGSFDGRAGSGRRTFLVAGIVSAALLAGPACGSGTDRVAAGSEGAACYPNKTCDTGLTCASDLCVALGGSNDDAGRPAPSGPKNDPVSSSTGGSKNDTGSPATSQSDDDAGPATVVCQEGERATDYSSCTSDNDCYSGNCCLRGMSWCGKQGDYPGYCAHPNTSAYKAGHGYSCQTDAECDAVAPDFIAHGGHGHCYKDALNDVPNGCGFDCYAPATQPTVAAGGASSGGGPLRSSGGVPGAGGAFAGGGGATQSIGGASSGAGGATQGIGGGTSSAGGATSSGHAAGGASSSGHAAGGATS